MKLSARNRISGTIALIAAGTMDGSAKGDVRGGDTATVIIKASAVMIGK